VAKLKSNLTRIGQRAPAAVKKALLQTGEDIANLTSQLTPVDTGALRDSYQAEPVTDNLVLIGSELEYAPYVEFGTSNSEAQPHLTPAFHQSEETFRANLINAIKEVL